MIRKYIKIYSLLLFVFSLITTVNYAQEVDNEYQTRTAFELSFKPVKKLKLSLSPEFRFDENYSLDKSLIEGEASYKIFKRITFSGAYRFIANQRKTKNTEYFSRYSFSVKVEKDFKRLESAFRLRYSNDSDDDKGANDFLRYKLSANYNIAKCKAEPYISVEAFQQLSNSELYKMRYALGVDYNLFKKNSVGVGYKFDYFKNEFLNKHIVSLNYKLKF